MIHASPNRHWASLSVAQAFLVLVLPETHERSPGRYVLPTTYQRRIRYFVMDIDVKTFARNDCVRATWGAAVSARLLQH